MSKVAASALAIAGLVALTVLLREGGSNDNGHAKVPEDDLWRVDSATGLGRTNERSSTPAGSVRLAPAMQPAQTGNTRSLRRDNDPSISEPSTAPTLPYKQEPDQASGFGTELSAHDATAAVGRPFPLSASVDRECKGLASPAETSCHDMREALAQFVQEPRDEPWATSIEHTVRDYLLTKHPGGQDIRALECRTSICAIECVAVESALCVLDYSFASGTGLLSHGGGRGFESDSAGSRVVVHAEVYMRRDPL